jgi:hypothetical protein
MERCDQGTIEAARTGCAPSQATLDWDSIYEGGPAGRSECRIAKECVPATSRHKSRDLGRAHALGAAIPLKSRRFVRESAIFWEE